MNNNIMSYKFFKNIFLRLNQTKVGVPHPSNMSRSINFNYVTSGYLNLLEQIHNFIKKESKLILVKQIYYIDLNIQKKLVDNSIEENINLLKSYNFINLQSMTIDKNLSEKKIIENYFILTNIIFNQQLDKLKSKYNDIIVVDPLDKFYEFHKNDTTIDGLHLNEFGNELLAESIFEAIRLKNFI